MSPRQLGEKMSKDESKENFARNLVVLCKSFSSVAEICRRSGVNRQQFNKYLSGKHLPNGRVRAQIAAFFQVEEDDLFKSPARFDELIEGPRLDISWKMRSSGAFQRIVPFIKGSAEQIKSCTGRTEIGFDVTIDGSVTACGVTASSGTPELDQRLCTLVSKRAAFLPAIDASGSARVAHATTAVTWFMTP
jgi:transcriptional regulator with XRE-family HTH domain